MAPEEETKQPLNRQLLGLEGPQGLWWSMEFRSPGTRSKLSAKTAKGPYPRKRCNNSGIEESLWILKLISTQLNSWLGHGDLFTKIKLNHPVGRWSSSRVSMICYTKFPSFNPNYQAYQRIWPMTKDLRGEKSQENRKRNTCDLDIKILRPWL